MNKSEKFWDKVSNLFNSSEKKIKQNSTSFKTIEATKKMLDSSDVVLDYGCGPGTITIEIAESVKTMHAIDISSGMIEVAKGTAAKRNIENIDFEHSNLFDEQYKKESFNVILAFNILHFIEDTPKVMLRLNDLLKPGGLFISATACLGERKTFLSMMMFFLTKIGVVPKMNFFKISELENLMTDGNFTLVDRQRLSRLPACFIVAKKI
jgi:2-polyprenyl-3-methyl-5-hydroxy-6-metoxy-1,4-benzoquinol methylase